MCQGNSLRLLSACQQLSPLRCHLSSSLCCRPSVPCLPRSRPCNSNWLDSRSGSIHHPCWPHRPRRAKHACVPAAASTTQHPRPPAHVLPLIEYVQEGDYVVLCPKHALLSLQPDTPEWFAWLATLSSFRFVGKASRLTAHREVQRVPGAAWRASQDPQSHHQSPPGSDRGSDDRRVGVGCSRTSVSPAVAAFFLGFKVGLPLPPLLTSATVVNPKVSRNGVGLPFGQKTSGDEQAEGEYVIIHVDSFATISSRCADIGAGLTP